MGDLVCAVYVRTARGSRLVWRELGEEMGRSGQAYAAPREDGSCPLGESGAMGEPGSGQHNLFVYRDPSGCFLRG